MGKSREGRKKQPLLLCPPFGFALLIPLSVADPALSQREQGRRAKPKGAKKKTVSNGENEEGRGQRERSWREGGNRFQPDRRRKKNT